jgi:hypothetical protein
MIPTNSSVTTNGCDNISSNCVIWQGPDIACIDLCTGDTVSDVVAKLATEVCTIITDGVTANPNLTGLDLTCLNIPGTTPTTLVPVLQAMVNQICANKGSGQIFTTSSSLSTERQVQNDLPLMTLPACLQYNDPSGNPVTQLRLDEFSTLIANQVCTNLSSINVINSTLSSYGSRLDILEACVLPCSGVVAETQVIPTCIINVGQLTDVSVLLLALEARFCALETAVGLPSAINSAIGQSVIVGTTSTLTDTSSSYGSIVGWNNDASDLAQSVQNAWVVIDDMYTAIQSIQQNCCSSGCEAVSFQYTVTNILAASGLIEGLNFNFSSSSIPNDFTDPSGYSNLSVTDGDGNSISTEFNVATLQNSAAGLNVLTPTLNTATGLTVALNFAVSDSITTCEETASSVITGIVPCPVDVVMNGTTTTQTTVTFSNQLGVTATYLIEILDETGTTVIDSYTENNPGSTVTHTFTGLSANTNYNTRVTTTLQGVSKVCDLVPFNTSTAAAPCDAGMDVAFVIDYTSSMSSQITAIKGGVASLVNTIDTSSGANDYRLALVTADEFIQPQPIYSVCADYASLPAAQKVVSPSLIGTYQYITSWEQFATNNGTTFTTQLNKLDGGVDGTCVNLGQGGSVPEPTDYASQLITGSSNLCGVFRANVAKYVIIITDNLPGGQYDSFVAPVWAGIQQMITDANTNGIKYFVCGSGAALSGNINGTQIFPWKELSIQTGGNWNTSSDPSVISSEIIAGCS